MGVGTINFSFYDVELRHHTVRFVCSTFILMYNLRGAQLPAKVAIMTQNVGAIVQIINFELKLHPPVIEPGTQRLVYSEGNAHIKLLSFNFTITNNIQPAPTS